MLSNDINMNLLFIYIQSFTKLIFKLAVSRMEPKIRFSALEEQAIATALVHLLGC